MYFFFVFFNLFLSPSLFPVDFAKFIYAKYLYRLSLVTLACLLITPRELCEGFGHSDHVAMLHRVLCNATLDIYVFKTFVCIIFQLEILRFILILKHPRTCLIATFWSFLLLCFDIGSLFHQILFLKAFFSFINHTSDLPI